MEKKLEYRGKSKDVYALANGNILMEFGDSYTGVDGVEDPGANQNMGTKEGLGRRNLAISTFLFEQIANKLDVPTHHVKADLEKGTLECVRAGTLGKGFKFEQDGQSFVSAGMEFIARNLAWGSFVKRFPSSQQGMMIPDAPFVEVSLKNDDAGDPFLTRDEYIAGGIATKHYDKGVEYTRKIAVLMTELFRERGLELIDIKMEFGVTADDRLLLIDEISPGSLRAMKDGELVTKEVVHSAFNV